MSKFFKINAESYISFEYDRHYNGEFNKVWAKELLRQIESF